MRIRPAVAGVAAGAQEMASSAEELSAQSDGMRKLMAQFTLSNGGGKGDIGAGIQHAQSSDRESSSRAAQTSLAARTVAGAREESGHILPFSRTTEGKGNTDK